MTTADRKWSIVVPVTGFITVDVLEHSKEAAKQCASRVVNRALADKEWTIQLTVAGSTFHLHVDPLAEASDFGAFDGKRPTPQEASLVRVRKRSR